MQVAGRKGVLAIRFARGTRLGGQPIERDGALTARSLEHDDDHGRARRREAAPPHGSTIRDYGAARLGVPERQPGAAALHRAGGLQDDPADRVARLVVHHVGAVDGPAERAALHVDRGAQATVADECTLAPPTREAVPYQAGPPENRGPITSPGGRPRRPSRRGTGA